MKFLSSWCSVWFVAALAAQAPAPVVEDLGELLAKVRAERGVPALGVVVLVDGELRGLGVSGVRRQGHPQLVTVDDRWHLGSCTKVMTATLLAKYVERGSLQWTTTVAEALPDLAATLHADARGITVRDLLTHRAGLPGGPPEPLWGQLFDFPGSDAEARTKVAATMLAVAPEAKPGARFLYSNAGYMIAGAIVERVGKAPWAELMQRELFGALGITSAGFGMPGAADGTTEPWGHQASKSGPVPVFADNPPSLGPAGTAHMTLRDWAKFAALHLGVVVDHEHPLLTAASLAALRTPPAGADYALGWVVTKRPWAPGPVLTHSGSNTMWYCVAWLAPEAKFAVLVTCNQGEAAAACDAVAAACVQRFRRQ